MEQRAPTSEVPLRHNTTRKDFTDNQLVGFTVVRDSVLLTRVVEPLNRRPGYVLADAVARVKGRANLRFGA